MHGRWVVLVLALALAQRAAFSRAACEKCSVTSSSGPVCTVEGGWVYSKCAALCQGMTIKDKGKCKGDKVKLVKPNPDPDTGGVGTMAGGAIKLETMQKFNKENFFFKGKLKAFDVGSKPKVLPFGVSSEEAAAADKKRKKVRFRASALRITATGEVYGQPARMGVPPTRGQSTRGQFPTVKLATQQAGARRRLQAGGNITDDRYGVCKSQMTEYPYSAVAYLQAESGGFTYRCSASMIGPNDALTAAHCVYDVFTGEYYTGWEVFAGIYSPADGSRGTQPFPVFKHSYVTLFDRYTDGSIFWCRQYAVCGYDMAIIKLRDVEVDGVPTKPGALTGTLGIGFSRGGQQAFQAQTCGYPASRDSYGGDELGKVQLCNFCELPYRTLVPARDPRGPLQQAASCAQSPGASGSPMWLNDNSVRGTLSGAYTTPPLGPPEVTGISLWATITRPMFKTMAAWLELPP